MGICDHGVSDVPYTVGRGLGPVSRPGPGR